ncbi:MAG: hypothetical protein IS632_02155 [Thaumarchaeota archaeon]|nr:hypothetical protein [Nitrososphaerota archaeon]
MSSGKRKIRRRYKKTDGNCLKWLLLLATITITPVIAGLPEFECWHLAPLWGGGGLTTIMVWHRTSGTAISPEAEAVLRYERMRMRHASLRMFIAVASMTAVVLGGIVMFMPFQDPQALDKILAFFLDLAKG